MTHDNIKNTRCLIDYDGTIANSLVHYNKSLDEMFMGKLTDKHYIEHYKDFGDAYEIIPGSPWKSILSLLCRYLATEHKIGALDTSNEYLTKEIYYDLGTIDAMLLVAYNASFVEHTPANLIIYTTPDDVLIAVCLDDICMPDHIEYACATADEKGCVDYKVLVPNEYAIKTPDMEEAYSHLFYMDDVEDELERIFEEKSCKTMAELSFEELGIAPVIEWCRRYKDAGGSLVIQSGSNPAIIAAMNRTLGIEGLFDGIYCSPMFDMDASNTSPWAYKTRVIAEAAAGTNSDGRRMFVMGDTKGDAFGAYENDLPFFLCWRGYPADPTKLSAGDGGYLRVASDSWADFSPERVEAHLGFSVFEGDIEHMMAFADAVGAGEKSAPEMEE